MIDKFGHSGAYDRTYAAEGLRPFTRLPIRLATITSTSLSRGKNSTGKIIITPMPTYGGKKSKTQTLQNIRGGLNELAISLGR